MWHFQSWVFWWSICCFFFFFLFIRFVFQWGESSPSSVGFSFCQKLSSGSSIYNETSRNEHSHIDLVFFFFLYLLLLFLLLFAFAVISMKWKMNVVIDRVCCWWTFFSCLQFTEIQWFGPLFLLLSVRQNVSIAHSRVNICSQQ